MRFLISPFTDPFLNSALEQWLAEQIDAEGSLLLMWRNSDSVIIGRNQNPWKECNLQAMRSAGVRLCRRVSGGGTVFHDSGNINFSFLSSRRNYNQNANMNIMRKILNNCIGNSVNLSIRKSADIFIQDKKVSGSAFRVTTRYAFHHLTLLVCSNLELLSACLRPPQMLRIETKGVASRPSAVINLADVQPGIGWRSILKACGSAVSAYPEYLSANTMDIPAVYGERRRLMGAEWRFRRTPDFFCSIGNYDDPGGEIVLCVHRGRIQEAVPRGTASAIKSLKEICAGLQGKYFGSAQSTAQAHALLRRNAAQNKKPASSGELHKALDAMLRTGL